MSVAEDFTLAISMQLCMSVPDELDFPCKEPFVSYNVAGSCDGLFCISGGAHDLFLWNPSIRKSKKLPFSGSNVHCSSYLAYGVGYNECQDDYKVVEVMASSHSEYGFQNEFRVYSLKPNSWKMIEEYPGVIFCNDPAKFVNGRLHWIATHVQMDVWVMKAYGLVESWTKVASIPYLTAIQHSLFPVFISRNDEILLQHGSSLLIYNSTHNTFKHPQVQIHHGYGIQFSLYTKSLVSPHFVEEVEKL